VTDDAERASRTGGFAAINAADTAGQIDRLGHGRASYTEPTAMKSQQTQEILDHLGSIRRRIDELRSDWEAHHDVDVAAHQLHELAATSTGYPSIEALLLGAAELIKRGEPAGHRLEKLSDHLHGYMVGWEDAAEARAPS
jgi:hypothetical protein